MSLYCTVSFYCLFSHPAARNRRAVWNTHREDDTVHLTLARYNRRRLSSAARVRRERAEPVLRSVFAGDNGFKGGVATTEQEVVRAWHHRPRSNAPTRCRPPTTLSLKPVVRGPRLAVVTLSASLRASLSLSSVVCHRPSSPPHGSCLCVLVQAVPAFPRVLPVLCCVPAPVR